MCISLFTFRRPSASFFRDVSETRTGVLLTLARKNRQGDGHGTDPRFFTNPPTRKAYGAMLVCTIVIANYTFSMNSVGPAWHVVNRCRVFRYPPCRMLPGEP